MSSKDQEFMEAKVKELREIKDKIKNYAGKEQLQERFLKHRSTARQRIEQLMDPGSFVELDMLVTHHCSYFNMDKRKIPAEGVITGFGKIDDMTSGLQNSDLIIIAGRPSMGKTALALDIARHAALEVGIPVALFSLEMAKEQLAIRLLSSEARVDSQRIRRGFLGETDWPKLTTAAGRLSEAPIFIDDTPAIMVLEMKAKARRLKAETGLGLIILDYLQLMRSGANKDSREQEISEISRSLKSLAKELRVPLVALSQLNRRVEDRTNRRPQMADLRESGAIEQDADLIAFIYRDEVYNRSEDNPERGIAEIIIGKQRNGPTGVVKLAFLEKYTRFENLAHLEESSLSLQ